MKGYWSYCWRTYGAFISALGCVLLQLFVVKITRTWIIAQSVLVGVMWAVGFFLLRPMNRKLMRDQVARRLRAKHS